VSIIPATERLDLYEGHTLDETWTFYEDEDQTELTDFSGWSAAAKVRKDYDAATALISMADIVTIGTPPSVDGIVLGGTAGTARLYVRDETMATLNASDFTDEPQDDGTHLYTGVWDLQLTNPDGETFTYARGKAYFFREATY
jgi:hypothetical protein